MTAKTLQGVAEKLGIKITNSDIKKGKAIIIKKIMAAEEANASAEKPQAPVEATEEPIKEPETVEVEETKPATKKAAKKANLKLSELTYKGETKSIKEWAAQIGMTWPTLYDRVNRNGWPVDLAIETPLGQRRPKNKES